MTPHVFQLQAIVFDFDGVIADTEPVHFRAFQEELAQVGVALTLDDYYARYLGYSDREGFPAVALDQGIRLTDGQVDALIARKTVRVQQLLGAEPLVFPGVAERVREFAAQVPVAVASGALRAEIGVVLKMAGLDVCFPVIVSADDPVTSKPSPEPYQLALARLGRGAFVPSACVAIEDSRWGIVAARAAGMRVVGVTSSYPADALSDADLVVGSVAELTVADLARLVTQPPRP